ncbi:MAG: Crp/Fnr family transcriptional regulator [Acidobacteria bacterium]|nr:MAG: Crp/Fnr family transcriptional regulator [Acidobacteriota bacterium]
MKLEEDYVERQFGVQKVKKGSMLFSEGGFCSGVPYLKEGRLKVYLISDNGREITLYWIEPGQMCILAMITVYSGVQYPAYTYAEEDSSLVLVPSATAVRWLHENSWWRSLFMKDLSENVLYLFTLLNSMVSESVERRILQYLLESSRDRRYLEITQEELAKDIGSVRVVVNRVLKSLEREGVVEVLRGKVFIKDHERLKKRIGGNPP